MVAQNIFFGLIAAMSVISALRVVTCRNVVHSALYLVLVLVGIAGNFILLGAEFIGLTQVMVYVGSVVVLFLFGIMLTNAPMKGQTEATNRTWPLAAAVAIAIAGLLSVTLIDAFRDDKLPDEPRILAVHETQSGEITGSNTAAVSDSIFGDYLVPFEVVSVLLLSALIGAIVLARKE